VTIWNCQWAVAGPDTRRRFMLRRVQTTGQRDGRLVRLRAAMFRETSSPHPAEYPIRSGRSGVGFIQNKRTLLMHKFTNTRLPLLSMLVWHFVPNPFTLSSQ
jgi:hypothetical protein